MLPFMPILNLPFIIILIHSIFINLFEIKEKWRLNFFIHSKHKLEQTLSLTTKWLMTSYQHNVHHPASLTLSVSQSGTPCCLILSNKLDIMYLPPNYSPPWWPNYELDTMYLSPVPLMLTRRRCLRDWRPVSPGLAARPHRGSILHSSDCS